MQAPMIVIPHVAPEREAQLAIRCEPHAVDHFGLQRMKERLHMRVVPGGPPARSALPDTQDPEAIAEPLGGILLPRSLWKMRPGRGRRRRTAASSTARVR